MSKSYKIYLKDILKCIKKVERYIKNCSKENFLKNEMLVDAIIRNLDVMGEAAKKIPPELRKKHQEIEWQKIAGLRDVLIHDYSGIDFDLLWEIITIRVPPIKGLLNKILRETK